ncbi:hypothetical protein BE20_19660 [Sorangium cellulosum]|nr:hypothetical protein BE20_19660 [Sorangium cellulosum]
MTHHVTPSTSSVFSTCSMILMVSSTSLTPAMPALSRAARLSQFWFDARPVRPLGLTTESLPQQSVLADGTWISMPGVISLPICTMSGRAPAPTSAETTSFV